MSRVDWLITQMKIPGGVEHQVRNAVMPLSREFDLRLISLASGGGLVDACRDAGIEVIELEMDRANPWPAISRLYELWTSDPPEILHTHLYHAGIIGRLLAARFRIPAVFVQQGGPEFGRSRLRSLADRLTSRFVTRYHVSCHAVARILIQRERVPGNKISVFPNGIQPILPSADHGKLPPRRDGRISLIACGRLVREKRFDLLLRAYQHLKPAASAGLELKIFGAGPDLARLTSLATNLNLDPQEILLGSRDSMNAAFLNADLFILPSDWEGVSLAMLEAMSAGLPVIARRTGGTPEVILDGENGKLIDGSSPIELAAAIEELISKPDRMAAYSRNNIRKIIEQHTVENHVQGIRKLYSNAGYETQASLE